MKKILVIVCFCLLCIASEAFAQTGFREVKLRSQLFNGAAVGKAVIPSGWSVKIDELTLNPESITWPNAIVVTASSPDGSVIMKYVSNREFQQQFIYALGFSSQSEDEAYDSSNMRHNLNYRKAPDSCDYMVNILFPNTYHSFLSETPISDSDAAAVNAYWQLYDSQLRNAYSGMDSSFELKGTEVTLAERIYQSGGSKTVVSTLVAGHECMNYVDANSYTDTINWNMACIYAMQAPASVFDRYRDIFDVFVLNTSTSQEYAAMTNLHSNILFNYFMMLKTGNPPSEQQLESDLNGATDQTISTGDTYSAMEGWSDVIQDNHDYTLSSGSHIKLSTSYDHVYEGDDGTIYAGFGSFYPEGTTELFPTQIGK
jgi:hypothetical protein